MKTLASYLWAAYESSQANNENAYWLLDRSALPADWCSRYAPAQPWIDLLRGDGFPQKNAVTPVLVEVQDNPKKFQDFIGIIHRDVKYANAVALITTPLDMSALQKTLCCRSRVELPDKLEVVLRFFDTRSLNVLPAVLTPEQYAQFLKDITAWYYLDRYGEVQCLPIARRTQEPYLEDARFVLSAKQEAMLIEDGVTDAVIDHLLTQGLGGLLETLPPQQFDTVNPLVQEARQQGKHEYADVFEFVAETFQEAQV